MASKINQVMTYTNSLGRESWYSKEMANFLELINGMPLDCPSHTQNMFRLYL